MAEVEDQHQAAADGPNGANPNLPKSLYIGDLDFDVTDSQLFNLFSQIGHVLSVRVCRDLSTHSSLGYGYVNYENPQDAAKAMEELNFTPVNGKSIRIMYSNRDPAVRKNGTANIFVKNLDKSVDHKTLHDTFSPFGNILSCKVATDTEGQSKGHGFVQYDTEEAAQNAIDNLNGQPINDRPMYVAHFLRKQERESATATDKAKFSNLYVKNLSESTTKEDLKKIFGEYGLITSAVVMRDGDGKSKCFGFVNFGNADDAAKAVEALNGKTMDGKEWYVGRAQKKSERELELKAKSEQSVKESVDKYQGANLYVKNLDDTIDDEKLKELFSEFGTITSCKVMRDKNGTSLGSGFVAFSSRAEASHALARMSNKLVVSKPLYVARAQRKEERKAKLQAKFSQERPLGMVSSPGPRSPMYSPGSPGLGQQFLHGQGPPFPQAGFGYQQQFLPRIGAGSGLIRNFFVPGGHGHAVQPVIMPHEIVQRGGFASYPPARNMGQSMPISALAAALANATPEQQRMILGENLYHLVEQLEPDHAAKITGMFLEMGQTEVLRLLESPEGLKNKVDEAMDVLMHVAAANNSPLDQLAGLSLNDNNLVS